MSDLDRIKRLEDVVIALTGMLCGTIGGDNVVRLAQKLMDDEIDDETTTQGD